MYDEPWGALTTSTPVHVPPLGSKFRVMVAGALETASDPPIVSVPIVVFDDPPNRNLLRVTVPVLIMVNTPEALWGDDMSSKTWHDEVVEHEIPPRLTAPVPLTIET